MARIDPLLKMIAAQGATELQLQAGEKPRLFHGQSPLRFFLPAMNDGVLRSLVQPEVDAGEWAAFEEGEALEFEREHPDLGRFTILARLEDEQMALRIARVFEEPKPTSVKARSPAPTTTPSEPALRAPPTRAPALEPLLEEALERGASDLHLAEGEPPVFRIDGRLLATETPVNLEGLLAGVLDEGRRAEVDAGAAADFALELPGRARFRGNVYRHSGGLAAAFRVLSKVAPPLERLRLPVDLRPLTDAAHGLVVVCGPTGSGKSTTLAALIQHTLQVRGGVLVTLEDPIEYTLPAPVGALVRQRQVGAHVRDFATGLRDALREDPDLLFVGEMRDRETIELALTAAETGHLVFTTLHSRSAAGAIDRVLDAYPPARQGQVRQQLADALRAVVAQRLVPARSGDGRRPALEVLRANQGVRALIREGRTSGLASAIQGGGADGMLQLERCLADLVRQGAISREAAEISANDRGALRDFLR